MRLLINGRQGWLVFMLLFFSSCREHTKVAVPAPEIIECADYLTIFEDAKERYDAASAIRPGSPFQDLKTFRIQDPVAVYWLKMPLPQPLMDSKEIVLTFSNLTYVDIYVCRTDTILLHKSAGAFLSDSLIAPFDTRFSTILPVAKDSGDILLLKVRHTKHYAPVFDFRLQSPMSYSATQVQKERMNFWLQGAIIILFIYTFISWRFTRFRPYLWLLIFIAGIGLYSVSLSGYVVDWFFPVHPERGWRLTVHFLHLGLLGFYLLIIDFWQLKKHSRLLYGIGKWQIVVLAIVSVASFLIYHFTGNYYLVNRVNIYSFIFPITYILYTLYSSWSRLTRAQKHLAYGVCLYAASGMVITLGWVFFQEQIIIASVYITSVSIIGVVLIFLTGLKEELKQMEQDKNNMLQRLNRLQQNQNTLLEKKVQERTTELELSYQEVQKQKNLLSIRNARIETLNNEINHRVKNNLQLLYSYINLQLPAIKDKAAQEILKVNIARITAMMLVNQRLHSPEDATAINIPEFLTELAINVQNTYDPEKKVMLRVDPAGTILLSGKKALSLALVISELLTNSFKHAFNGQADAEIKLSFEGSAEQLLCLHYRDNGAGMQVTEVPAAEGSMGIQLTQDLIRQMGGELAMENNGGLHYTIILTDYT